MIDIQLLRTDPAAFQKACDVKGIKLTVADFVKLDDRRKVLLMEVEKMRGERNAVSKKIAEMKGEDKAKAVKAMKELGTKLTVKETELTEVEAGWHEMHLLLPSIPHPKVPVGKTDKDNVEIRREGTVPTFDFQIKDHVALGEALGIVDIPRGVKVGGSRFYFLKGDGVRLEMAVMQLTLDLLVKRGFTAFAPPLLANYNAMMGTSYFPGGEEQAYAVGVDSEPLAGLGEKDAKKIESDRLFLIGTSEVAVASYHADETFKLSDLPKRYCGISACFRREAGTYGKDTHGLYRVHQFQKVEQVILCENDAGVSEALHKEILTNAEDVLKALKLPYRVVDVCTGDMGRGQVYKNDIETWMPSRNSYGETHSCSTFADFQARRLNIKYEAKNGTKKFVHTLNNTCIASPRILIPILEIYQNQDGSVTIPDVLQPYMGGQEKIVAR